MSVADNLRLEAQDRRRGRTKPETNWAEWKNTHTIELTKEEIEDVLAVLETETPDVMAFITGLADLGIKTSFKYDRRRNQYDLRIFRDNPEMTDAGYALVVKGANYERCIGAMMFALGDVQDFDLKEVTALREGVAPDF